MNELTDIDINILKNIMELEKRMKQTIYNKPLPFQKGYRLIRGSKPILISAPHSARTLRFGKVRPRENYVGSIVDSIARESGCYGLYTINVIKDPNRHYGAYKKVVEGLIRDNEIKFIIDLHGASNNREFDVDIGTYGGESIRGGEKYLEMIKESFKRYNISNISENFFTSDKSRTTITRFGYLHGIPSVQLEIRKKFRYPSYGDEILHTIHSLSEAVQSISESMKIDQGINKAITVPRKSGIWGILRR